MFDDVLNEAFAQAGGPTFTRPYCTLQDVADECRVKQPDDVSASVLRKFASAIQLATGQVETYCQRDFWFHNNSEGPLTIFPKWVAGGEIYLPWPILSLNGISQSGAAMTNDQWIVESTDSFSRIRRNLQSDFNLLRYGYGDGNDYASGSMLGVTYNGRESYWKYLAEYSLLSVTGTFGYPLALQQDGENLNDQLPPPTLPGPVRRAATLIAAAWSGENRKEFRSMDGDTTSVLDERMPKEAAMILRPYVYRVI